MISFDFVDSPGASRAPLLFVHGFPLTRSMWQAQRQPLGGIFPDLRGFGSSRFATTAPGMVTMEEFADDLCALLDRQQIARVTLCGLSMGGYIAWQFVRKYPDRLQSLILCDTRAVADSAEGAAGRRKTADDVVVQGPGMVAEAMLPKLLSPRTAERQPDVVALMRDTILAQDPVGIAAALRGMAARPDASALLPGIRLPTLVIVGEDDKIATPDEMRGIAEAIPGATFVIIPDAGHMSPLENPAAFNLAVQKFLEAQGSP